MSSCPAAGVVLGVLAVAVAAVAQVMVGTGATGVAICIGLGGKASCRGEMHQTVLLVEIAMVCEDRVCLRCSCL